VVHSNLESDRQTFEQWFQRAMDANPDNFDACSLKMEFLNPDRHSQSGSVEEMIRFGRWCLETKDWYAGMPSLLIRAHHHAAETSPDQAAYMRRPDVWEDGRAVFEGALANLDEGPVAVNVRSRFARWAVECEQWAAANKLFEVLGDKTDVQPFGSRENYVYSRNKARRLAAESTPQPAPEAPPVGTP
jgi:hypothetical protein